MSKSTNTVVYFDWKTVIYIYVCAKCRTQFMLPMKKSVTFTSACANEIIPSINRSLVYKAKEGPHVRIIINSWLMSNCWLIKTLLLSIKGWRYQGAIRSRKSKDRQYTAQRKKDKCFACKYNSILRDLINKFIFHPSLFYKEVV